MSDAAEEVQVSEVVHRDLDGVRLRLLDAASELKPIDGPQELVGRAREVARQLRSIEEDLLLFVHCSSLEASDFEAQLDKIDAQLAGGWQPESAPVEDVVDRLRAEFVKP